MKAPQNGQHVHSNMSCMDLFHYTIEIIAIGGYTLGSPTIYN
jgi:hypothetical protein